MKAVVLRITLLAGLFGLVACSNNNVTVNSDYKQGVDFASFKTYQWHGGNNFNTMSKEYINNDIVEERIRKDIDETLAAKNFQLKPKGQYLRQNIVH